MYNTLSIFMNILITMKTKETNMFKVIYTNDDKNEKYKKEIIVIASDYDNAFEKANKILSEYSGCTIWSVQHIGWL